jgi:hypothetical protein
MTEIKCKDNAGFEDQLTEGESYEVVAFSTNSVMVKDRKGVCRWYGDMHFERETVVMDPAG